jgi:hypothetical protein
MISRPASPADLALATLLARPKCLPHKHRQVVDDRLGAKVRYSSEVPQPWNPSQDQMSPIRLVASAGASIEPYCRQLWSRMSPTSVLLPSNHPT